MPTSVKKIGDTKVNTGLGKFVEETLVNAPDTTTIINRAKVSNSLKCIMGNERIHVNSLKKLTKEQDVDGKVVYEPDNGDSRVRFVGSGWDTVIDSNGMFPNNSTTGDYVEVIFYGTGLNWLGILSASARDVRPKIDDDPEGTNITTTNSAVITSRNYKVNKVIPVVKDLILGWHRVKLTNYGSNFSVQGFEIVNKNSQIVVPAGTCFSEGQKLEVSSAVLDYNAGFENVLDANVGQKGGRAIIAVDKEDGVVKKWFTKTDPAVTVGDPTELVTNGTFDTDVSGWTVENGGTITYESGAARVSRGVTSLPSINQVITTVIGQKYNLKLDLGPVQGSVNSQFVVHVNDAADPRRTNNVYTSEIISLGASVSLDVVFTANSTSTRIDFAPEGNTDANALVDNVSVKETAYDFLALDDADHSDEAAYRKINFTEFGRNRSSSSPDFSTLVASYSDRAFTLDDGTTTLVGDNAFSEQTAGGETFFVNNNSRFIITFVGTGIDLVLNETGTSGDINNFFIDDIAIGSKTPSTYKGVYKIASGLPYGTHTLKMESPTQSQFIKITDFIIYQPKKPTLPEGAVELADYNIMADFVANTTAGIETMSTGVLRKDSSREMIYSGNWIQETMVPTNNMSFQFYNTANGGYFEYTFFGTGFDIRGRAFSSYATDATITIDGNSDLSSYTINAYGGYDIDDPSTGSIRQDLGDIKGSGVAVSGLPLGVHTVRVTQNGTDSLVLEAFDIITPIHSPHTTFGSRSIRDLRNFDIKKDVNKKPEKFESTALFNLDDNIVYDSKNISQIVEAAPPGDYIVYLEDIYLDGCTVTGSNFDAYVRDGRYLTSTGRGKFDRGWHIRLINTKHDSNKRDGSTNVKISGFLQKDELDREDEE